MPKKRINNRKLKTKSKQLSAEQCSSSSLSRLQQSTSAGKTSKSDVKLPEKSSNDQVSKNADWMLGLRGMFNQDSKHNAKIVEIPTVNKNIYQTEKFEFFKNVSDDSNSLKNNSTTSKPASYKKSPGQVSNEKVPKNADWMLGLRGMFNKMNLNTTGNGEKQSENSEKHSKTGLLNLSSGTILKIFKLLANENEWNAFKKLLFVSKRMNKLVKEFLSSSTIESILLDQHQDTWLLSNKLQVKSLILIVDPMIEFRGKLWKRFQSSCSTVDELILICNDFTLLEFPFCNIANISAKIQLKSFGLACSRPYAHLFSQDLQIIGNHPIAYCVTVRAFEWLISKQPKLQKINLHYPTISNELSDHLTSKWFNHVTNNLTEITIENHMKIYQNDLNSLFAHCSTSLTKFVYKTNVIFLLENWFSLICQNLINLQELKVNLISLHNYEPINHLKKLNSLNLLVDNHQATGEFPKSISNCKQLRKLSMIITGGRLLDTTNIHLYLPNLETLELLKAEYNEIILNDWSKLSKLVSIQIFDELVVLQWFMSAMLNAPSLRKVRFKYSKMMFHTLFLSWLSLKPTNTNASKQHFLLGTRLIDPSDKFILSTDLMDLNDIAAILEYFYSELDPNVFYLEFEFRDNVDPEQRKFDQLSHSLSRTKRN